MFFFVSCEKGGGDIALGFLMLVAAVNMPCVKLSDCCCCCCCRYYGGNEFIDMAERLCQVRGGGGGAANRDVDQCRGGGATQDVGSPDSTNSWFVKLMCDLPVDKYTSVHRTTQHTPNLVCMHAGRVKACGLGAC